MDPLEVAYGDMYFSTFLNQVPYQLENYLQELVDPAEDDVAFSKGSEGKTRNKVYMVKCSSSPQHFFIDLPLCVRVCVLGLPELWNLTLFQLARIAQSRSKALGRIGEKRPSF